MKLSDLIDAIGPERLVPRVLIDGGGADVVDVVIADPRHPVGRGQLVLAVGRDVSGPGARELVAAAATAGAAGVVFQASDDDPTPTEITCLQRISLLSTQPYLGWAQLVTMLRGVITAADSEPAQPEAPFRASMHELADAIAGMVGGSVVLYEQAHRVLAYSVQGYEIDDVRRETILTRQTPQQWVQRFTEDRNAYRTLSDPAKAIRVDGYPGLQPRLRAAICSDGEILGEISVAESQTPLGGDSESALLHAAKLAVPYMLRHRLVEDGDRVTRSRLLREFVHGDSSAAVELGMTNCPGFVVVGFEGARLAAAGEASLSHERVLRLLSMQLNCTDTAAEVLNVGSTYYAVISTSDDPRRDRHIAPALRHLERMGTILHGAVGPWVGDAASVATSRQTADDILRILRRRGWPPRPTVVSSEDVWSDLALLPVDLALSATPPCTQLRRLLEHDELHLTNYTTTLRVFLEEFGSVSRASERLVLHPNTLRHRLARLADISGLDLTDHSQRLAVEVQLRVLGTSAIPT